MWFNECFVFIIVRVEEGDGAGERGLNSVENDNHIFVYGSKMIIVPVVNDMTT